MNQSYACEQAMLTACVAGDLITSQILSELSGSSVTVASAYLIVSAKAGRLELIGKTVNLKRPRSRHVYVYRVTPVFFVTRMSRNPDLNMQSGGGAVGRTWKTKELPMMEIDRER